MTALIDRLLKPLVIRNNLARNVASEFFCTLFYFFLSCSASGQLTFDGRDDWLGYMFALCFALTLAIQMGSVASGGHLNPAISFFLFMNGFLSPIQLILYIIVQTIGAFCGASLAFFMYYDIIDAYDGGAHHMAGTLATNFIFFPDPAHYNVIWKAFIEEILGGCVLGVIGTMVYDPTVGVSKAMQPVLAGLGIALTGLTFNMTAGFELNPVRYLGTRLFTLCVGYGKHDIGVNEAAWFWIPIFCPMIGTTIGSWLFKIFIGIHAAAAEAEQQASTAVKPIEKATIDLNSIFMLLAKGGKFELDEKGNIRLIPSIPTFTSISES